MSHLDWKTKAYARAKAGPRKVAEGSPHEINSIIFFAIRIQEGQSGLKWKTRKTGREDSRRLEKKLAKRGSKRIDHRGGNSLR